ncbi:MAG TPA: DinB family protein [Vicinamibacterales bacterium]|nr:DinB family protein [Vicinamibacterales bacterium]
MQTLLSSIVVVAIVFVSGTSARALEDIDRQRLLAHLEMTESWLKSEISGLSKAQLTFRMSPESWSVMDVVEHLAIAEPQYWQRVHDSMKQPATTEKMEATDAAILWYGVDRTNRNRTGEARVPKGKWTDIADSFGEFAKLRATMREYARTTTDDLRSRKLLDGNMDVYQWFLMISTHAQRHILQIREIKQHAAYPRT